MFELIDHEAEHRMARLRADAAVQVQPASLEWLAALATIAVVAAVLVN